MFLRVRSISAPFNAMRTVELVLESDPVFDGQAEARLTVRVNASSVIAVGDVWAMRMCAMGNDAPYGHGPSLP